MISSKTLLSSILIFAAVVCVSAFQTRPLSTRVQTSIAASNDDHSAELSRRNMLKNAAFAMSTLVAVSTVASQPAEASYSAYTEREKDWSERQSKGGEFNYMCLWLRPSSFLQQKLNSTLVFSMESTLQYAFLKIMTKCFLEFSLPDVFEHNVTVEIKYSSASSLRAQLRDIAPMNDEGTKIFCPNGPSAAVTPMMENKCSDRQALPSVYGRTEDSMGNSIPGFGGASPSLLRAQLEGQSYFRSN